MKAEGVTYTSGDLNILEVSEKGIVKGKHFGTATITVKDRYGFEQTVEMTVVKPGLGKGRDK